MIERKIVVGIVLACLIFGAIPITTIAQPTPPTEFEGQIEDINIIPFKTEGGYEIGLSNNLVWSELDVFFDGVYQSTIPKGPTLKYFTVDHEITHVIVAAAEGSHDKGRAWHRYLSEEDWQEYYIQLKKSEIEDIDPDKEGIQVKGIIEIPFTYNVPDGLEWNAEIIYLDGKEIWYTLDTGDHSNPKVKLASSTTIKLATHLFENGTHNITVELVDSECGEEFCSFSVVEKSCRDTVPLDFQNTFVVPENWEGMYTKGVWVDLWSFFRADFDNPEKELRENYSSIYPEIEKLKNAGYAGYDDVVGGEVEFVGDKEVWWEEIATSGIEIVSLSHTAKGFWGVVTCIGTSGGGCVATAVYFVGETIATTLGAEILKNIIKESERIDYENMPIGDLEGNRYAVFVATEGPKIYSNAYASVHRENIFFLDQNGEWLFVANPALFEYIEWEGTEADCIESIKMTEEGETKTVTLTIKDNVIPNLHDEGMHLDLEIPDGVEISNVQVKGGEDAEAKAVEFYRVSDLDKLFAFKLTRTSSEKGAARVAINIPEVYHGTEEIVSFDLTLEAGEAQQDPIRIFYGLIPAKVHSTGYYSGCYYAAHGIREPWGEYEDANPLTVKQPEHDSSSAGCSWIYFYEPYELKHSFGIMPTVATETFTNTIGMEFVLIPAGEFDMGSPSGEEDRLSSEGPLHHVTIGNPFYMGKYEVTQEQWRAIMGDKPSFFTGDDDLPVEQVSWDDVQEFIRKLNEKEGTDKYRLPSEAEWEYACRAGTSTRYSFGDSDSELGDYAWYSSNSGSQTHPVGQKKANPWGLYDMHGNVWEWVQDCVHNSYNGAPTDGSAWVISCYGAFRVGRGGGWRYYARNCWSAKRDGGDQGDRFNNLGFRLLREV